MLQEIEKIRQQCTHEGVHKDGPEYRAKIEAAMKEYMPLSVSTISIDITQPATFPIFGLGHSQPFLLSSCLLPSCVFCFMFWYYILFLGSCSLALQFVLLLLLLLCLCLVEIACCFWMSKISTSGKTQIHFLNWHVCHTCIYTCTEHNTDLKTIAWTGSRAVSSTSLSQNVSERHPSAVKADNYAKTFNAWDFQVDVKWVTL